MVASFDSSCREHMQVTPLPTPPNPQVAYSRAAYRLLTRLDATRRSKVIRLVNGVAANASRIVRQASTTFSADVEAGLRIVFLQASGGLTVLALTGEKARP
jgi:hypothetical protein